MASKGTENRARVKLEAMALADRIAVIAADVDSKQDEYRIIDPHDLAILLNVDASIPDGSWKRVWYIPRVPIEYIFGTHDEEYLLELIHPHMTPERYGQ